MRFMRAGVPEAVISRLLGASPQVILRNYARPLLADLRDAVNRLPAIGAVTQRPQNADSVEPDEGGDSPQVADAQEG